jgi:ribonucleoside-diphosphate reductase alpha chain
MLNDSPAAGRLPHAAQHWYDCMARLDFLPNPPTLMNAGQRLQRPSACFGLPVEDSLASIYDSLKHQDSSTNQAATLDSHLVTYAFTTAGPGRVVKRRGLRNHFLHPPFQPLDRRHLARRDQRGANMDILCIDHSDILDFIALKQMPTEMTNLRNV